MNKEILFEGSHGLVPGLLLLIKIIFRGKVDKTRIFKSEVS